MWICASTISMPISPSCCSSRLLEVDPLGDRQPLEVAAQAVEPHLGCAQTYPLAAAENPAASGLGAVGGSDPLTDGATAGYPVRGVRPRGSPPPSGGRAR